MLTLPVSTTILKDVVCPCAEHDAGVLYSPDFVFYDWSMNIHRKARREDTFCFLPQEIYSTHVLPISKENIHILTLTKKNTRFKLGVLRHSWQLGWSLPARVQQKHSAGLEGRNPSEEFLGTRRCCSFRSNGSKNSCGFLVVCCHLIWPKGGRDWKNLVAIQQITSWSRL